MHVTIPIESPEDAAHELLKLGAEAEVLDPPELRDMLINTTQRLAALYLVSRDLADSRRREKRRIRRAPPEVAARG
jgi:hypothetical protein